MVAIYLALVFLQPYRNKILFMFPLYIYVAIEIQTRNTGRKLVKQLLQINIEPSLWLRDELHTCIVISEFLVSFYVLHAATHA